ncbi:MAG: GNAT family N-acetyltransferase [Anaerolineaceae bacterium]|nr:GNAT family N-acetyltransferase [Anaerolineaceae bacterium]
MDTQNLVVNVRKAGPDDVTALTEVIRSVEYFTHLIDVPFKDARATVARALQRDLTCNNDHLVLLAEDAEGRILGYCAVHWLPYLFFDGLEGYVSELFIHESARGRGVGAQLLEAVKAEARQRGCMRLSLLNGRQRDSYRREFYKKKGWRERDMANFVFDL